MADFNRVKMEDIADDVIKVLKVCLSSKDTWKSDKNAMLKLIQMNHPTFYESYPRICRSIVYENDITPLISMITTFAKVQDGDLSLNKANDMISGALNAKYVDPVLNSDKLVREREQKQRDEREKIEVIN